MTLRDFAIRMAVLELGDALGDIDADWFAAKVGRVFVDPPTDGVEFGLQAVLRSEDLTYADAVTVAGAIVKRVPEVLGELITAANEELSHVETL